MDDQEDEFWPLPNIEDPANPAKSPKNQPASGRLDGCGKLGIPRKLHTRIITRKPSIPGFPKISSKILYRTAEGKFLERPEKQISYNADFVLLLSRRKPAEIVSPGSNSRISMCRSEYCFR